MKRRDFFKKAGMAAAAASVMSAVPSRAQKTFYWKMATTWPMKFPLFQTGAERFAQRVEEVSGGRLRIRVYPAGRLVPALEVFDAVAKGQVECGFGASYFWEHKIPAAQWFSGVPFGLNAQGTNAWLYQGGGLALWEEVYAPFKVLPRPAGNTGAPTGGWFNRKINTLNDFRGLKIRCHGLGGKVLARAGAHVVQLPGLDIQTSLKKGTIEAAVWFGPYLDVWLGLNQAAQYCYYPGWQEPGTSLGIIFNQSAYDELTDDLKAVLDSVAMESNMWCLSEFEMNNIKALSEIVAKREVGFVEYAPEVLAGLARLAQEILAQEAARDAMSAKVSQAYNAFKMEMGPWAAMSEQAYFNAVMPRY